MRMLLGWVLASALILVGASAKAQQPAQNRAETPAGALSLPAEPPLTIAALDAAGELVNGTGGWRAPNLEEGASLMERAGAARERAAREAHRHHPHQDRVEAGRQQALTLYWQAHRVLQSPGSLYQYAQAALAAGHGEVACAILAFLANRGGYQGMSADNLREQMTTVASCAADWRLPERPVAPATPVPDPDGDGVVGNDDVCPTEASGSHPNPLRMGCPDGDSDGDGVFDSADSCPSVAQGSRPDPLPGRRGCPLQSQQSVITPSPVFSTVRRSRVDDIGPWVTIGVGVLALGVSGWQMATFAGCDGRIAANAGLQVGDRACAENSALAANVTLGIGSALVVGGVVWAIIRPARERRVQVTPQAILTPGLFGAGAAIAF